MCADLFTKQNFFTEKRMQAESLTTMEGQRGSPQAHIKCKKNIFKKAICLTNIFV